MNKEPIMSKKQPIIIVLSVVFTISAIATGYIALGLLPAFIFTFGYLGGLMIWLCMPMNASFKQIAIAYFLTLALFVVHKIEEREKDFFFLPFPSLPECQFLMQPLPLLFYFME